MANSEFVDYIIDLLSAYGTIRARRMFGGYGIYCNKIIFAIIINDELYFKAVGDLAKEYKNAGSFPFSYKLDNKTIALSYWQVPSEIIEEEDLLKTWFNKSLQLAIEKKLKRS